MFNVKNPKELFLLAVVNLGVLVIFLCLIEIFLRALFPVHLVGDNSFYTYDKELGYVATPGMIEVQKDYLLEHSGRSDKIIGFNRISHVNKKILVVGDSYVEGVGVPVDSTIPFFIEIIHNAREQEAVEVYNYGLSGRGYLQNEIAIDRFIDKYGMPDVIIYFGFDNDPQDDERFTSGYYQTSVTQGNPNNFLPFKVYSFINEFELVKRIKISYNRSGLSGSPHNKQNIPGKVESAKYNGLLKKYSDFNHRFIFTWATPGESYEHLKSLDASNFNFCDWYDLYYKIVSNNFIGLDMYNSHSGGHNRVHTNLIIAEALLSCIKDLK